MVIFFQRQCTPAPSGGGELVKRRSRADLPVPLLGGVRGGSFAVFIAVLAGIAIFATGCATTAQRGALARAYEAFTSGAYAAALDHATRAQRYGSDTPSAKAEALFLQGRCHEALNQREAASAAYEGVVRDFGTTDFAEQARKRLAELKR